MSARFFLDTNIFVYSFDENSPEKLRQARKLIRQAAATGKGVVSYQVVQEFFNVALKRFAQPMTATEAEQYLSIVFRPLLTVHSSQALYAETLHLKHKYRLSWYDSLIVAGAIEGQCSVLYTEDLQHERQIGSLRIENPFT